MRDTSLIRRTALRLAAVAVSTRTFLPEEASSAEQLLLPKGQKSTLKVVEARLPGIATAARNAMRKEFGRVVFLHLSVASVGPNEQQLAELALAAAANDIGG